MGRAFASCGHEVPSVNDLIPVEYTDEDIDHDAGRFVQVTVSAVFCPTCASKISEWPDGRIVPGM